MSRDMLLPDGGYLKQYLLFSSFSDHARNLLSQKVQMAEVPAGQEIITEGESGDAFFIVFRGEVEVLKKMPCGHNAVLSILGKGESFGEMALLNSSPRCATVVAKTAVTLLKLSKSDFDEIAMLDAGFLEMMGVKVRGHVLYNKIKTLEPFALLEPARVAGLLDKLQERNFVPGEAIIMQGEKGDRYFLIKAGHVAVLKKKAPEEEPEVVATLGEGEGFGEEALITGSHRNATVRAVDRVSVLALSKDDFDQVLKSSLLEEAYPEEIRGRPVFVDVRTPAEFQEEHIADAISIPLDELRRRYGELDPAHEYYVYCLTGTRSATAAFLLNMHGFRSRSIKGGFSAWTGPVSGRAPETPAPFRPT